MIEVCAYSVQSVINAQLAGASRVELCDNMFEGGTTPSYAAMELSRKLSDIVVHAIIRPRGGDFCYSDLEFDVMKRDIEMARSAGVHGIVIGILKPDGKFDFKRLEKLISIGDGLNITIHRAFDMCSEPFESVRIMKSLGVSRILTSGLKQTALEGIDNIKKLIELADNQIIIMPGSGVDFNNIAYLKEYTGAKEFHLSGKKLINGRMEYRNPDISMGGFVGAPEYEIYESNVDLIRKAVEAVK